MPTHKIWQVFCLIIHVSEQEINQTHSPVLASISGVSGEIHFDWWSPASILALSCNSSSKRCRKESHCTCITLATLSKNKKVQTYIYIYILNLYLNNSLLAAQSLAPHPAKFHSWKCHENIFRVVLFYRVCELLSE